MKECKDWKRQNSRKHVIIRVKRFDIPIQPNNIETFCLRPEVACGVTAPACARKKFPLPESRYEALAGWSPR